MAGRTQYGGGGTPVTLKSLWQIGSQTKAFTSVTMLQLEAAGKLTIDQTIGRWLPQIADLIAYVYPGNPHAPHPTTGYDYSNTNYLLAELIIERATGHTYASEIQQRFLKSDIGLHDTYYAADQYPRAVLSRIVPGYFFNHAGRSDSLGTRALPGPMLAQKQRSELMSIVSLKTGKAIAKTSLSDPRGFGLAVIQATARQSGTTWYYEGATQGYRMVYVYYPRQDVVIAFVLNSLPDSKQNQYGKLANTIYQTLHAAAALAPGVC